MTVVVLDLGWGVECCLSSLGLLALALLPGKPLLEFLDASSLLGLELLLCGPRALLELGLAVALDGVDEVSVDRYKSRQAVLEGNIFLVLLLSLPELLDLGLLVGLLVGLHLLLVVLLEMLDLLLTVGTLQVIDALAGDAKCLSEQALLLLKSLELEDTDSCRVKILDVLGKLDVDLGGGLQFLELLLNLLTLDALLLSLDTLLCALALLFSKATPYPPSVFV